MSFLKRIFPFQSFSKSLLPLLIFLFVSAALIVAIESVRWQYFLQRPLAITSTDFIYELKPGSSAKKLAADLSEKGIISHPRYLSWLAKLKGVDKQLHAGEYAIQPGTKPTQLLDQIAAGDVVQYPLTIVEGWTFSQLLTAMKDDSNLIFSEAKLDSQGWLDFFNQQFKQSYTTLEGLFLPDTYFYSKGTTERDLLVRAYEAMQQTLHDLWPTKSDDLPYDTPYDALVMASIIEKETRLLEEQVKVAGVLVKRMQINMPLQADATIIYGMGEDYTAPLRRADLTYPSIYNTYLHRGLPPTPIALPGRAAIQAVLKPKITDALYYVARGDGGHHFSSTLAEHNAAVRKYIHAR